MKAAQILGMGSLLALLVALGIVLVGQQAEVRDLLEPGSQGDVSRSKAASNSVIGKGAEASATNDLSTLIEETIYARVGQADAGPAEQLEAEVAKSEPEIPLGRSLAAGGYSMKVFAGGSSVVFCAKPDYYYVCQSINLSNRQKGEGRDHSLKIATRQAEGVARAGAAGRSHSPPKGSAAKGVGVSEGAIHTAQQLKSDGVR